MFLRANTVIIILNPAYLVRLFGKLSWPLWLRRGKCCDRCCLKFELFLRMEHNEKVVSYLFFYFYGQCTDAAKFWAMTRAHLKRGKCCDQFCLKFELFLHLYHHEKVVSYLFFYLYGKCTPRSSGRWQEPIYSEWPTSLPYAMTFLQKGLFLELVRESENSATYCSGVIYEKKESYLSLKHQKYQFPS